MLHSLFGVTNTVTCTTVGTCVKCELCHKTWSSLASRKFGDVMDPIELLVEIETSIDDFLGNVTNRIAEVDFAEV